VAGHVGDLRPRDVPGYAAAVTAGLTPVRPSRPPALRPGPTAHSALVGCGAALAGAAVLVIAALSFGPDSGSEATWTQLLTMLGATAAGLALVLASIGRFRRVLLAELDAGYVTTTFHQGLFWFGDRPGPRGPSAVVGWVWDGVWVLSTSGRAVRAPDPDVDPPGFYPSPHETGRLELWTGSQWLGVYRDARPSTR
jgi:hypothetical protein